MTEPESVPQITHVTDHVPSAVERMTQKYAAKPFLAALAAALFTSLQEVEDSLWALLTDSIDTAVGARLERIGRIVGFARDGLEDEPYRLILRAWILANRSSGTGEDILAVMAAMLGGYGLFTMAETGRASMLLEPSVATPHYASMIRVLERAKMGGVRIQMIYFTDPHVFTFAASRLLPEPDPDHGLGDTADSSVGGHLAGVIE